MGYNQIPCCADSVPELFWLIRPKVSHAASKRRAGTPIGEDTVDAISGARSFTFKLEMNEGEGHTQEGVQKQVQANRKREALMEKAPESVIWRSRL